MVTEWRDVYPGFNKRISVILSLYPCRIHRHATPCAPGEEAMACAKKALLPPDELGYVRTP